MGLPELSSNAPQPSLPTADRMTEEYGPSEWAAMNPILNAHDLDLAREELARYEGLIAEAKESRDNIIALEAMAWDSSAEPFAVMARRLAAAIREYEIDQCIGEPSEAPGGRWSAEVVDLSALVAAAYHDPAYLALLMVNQPAINKLARKDKGLTRIPGVKPIKTVASSRAMDKIVESSEGEKEFDW
jgi:hypothetical protein